ncbi:hypothetical protein [Klenkia brasiliensis]|uniref:Uncharacterized protein n=1 Tax=Klenkia brasiliensis TaxID=333142 RepID=A0A1G7ZSH0_9ACTN|nr:hypothetical protein [Klenkia brasiliensis]SDH11645.1 hypothetical protein SAMN05660324_4347 [Klenkia brasiliensis]
MAPPAVPRSWVWRARGRIACSVAPLTWVSVGLVNMVDGPVLATVVAYAIGLVILLALVTTRGPSVTEACAARALRTGSVPEGMSLAVVDTAAADLLRTRLARFALPAAVVFVVVGTAIWSIRGVTADKYAVGVVLSVNALAWGWATTTSAREALRWRAGTDERWAAWAAADGAAAG